MEIINNSTPGFKVKAGKNSGVYVSIHKDMITFSSSACEKFGILSTLKLNLVFDFDRLYFYIDDNESGLRLSKNKENVRCFGKCFYQEINIRYPRILNRSFTRFQLRETPTKLNDRTLIEILIHKKL
jgi:hypothetical protein